CVACVPGSFADVLGLTECNKCAMGTSGSEDTAVSEETCGACSLNSYSNVSGSTACTPCPSPLFTTEEGQAHCTKNCPIGMGFDWHTTECAPCAMDTYSDTEDSSLCTACPPDKIIDEVGSSGPCVAMPSLSTIDECVAGNWFETVRKICRPCSIGMFQDLSGQTSCQTCPTG
ncbi:hypothetical protein T484DRAFT_1568804, partial [Baffinella frigidus]